VYILKTKKIPQLLRVLRLGEEAPYVRVQYRSFIDTKDCMWYLS